MRELRQRVRELLGQMLRSLLSPGGLLFLGGLALYLNTLPFEFVFDDHVYIVKNPLLKETSSFWWNGDFREFANRAKSLDLDPDLSTNFILRPFAYLTFHLNYVLGGFSPAGYRLVNILIHCMNAVLLFGMAKRLLRDGTTQPRDNDTVCFISLTAAALFLVHPLQIESVTYIIQRFTSLGSLFYLVAVFAYLRFRAASETRESRSWRRISVGALLVGTLTKEFLFTVPFVLLLLEWLYFGTRLRVAIRRLWPWAIALPIVPALMLAISAAQTDSGLSLWEAMKVAGTQDSAEGYAWRYTLTQPGVILTYFRLFFLPVGLNIDPDRALCESITEWRVLGPMLVLLLIIVTAVIGFRTRSDDSRVRTVLFGVLWFFFTIATDSSFVPLPDLMAEHRTYLPSVGMFLAFSCVADIARTGFAQRWELRYVVPGVTVCALLALSSVTILRNELWRTNISLWSDTVAKSPNKYRPWKNLAVAYSFQPNPEMAALCFSRALELAPRSIDAHYGLADAVIACGNPGKGLEIADAGLRIAEHPALHYYKAVSLAALGNGKMAIASIERTLKLVPGHGPSHALWATIAAGEGDLSVATAHARIATESGGLTPSMQIEVARLLRCLEGGVGSEQVSGILTSRDGGG